MFPPPGLDAGDAFFATYDRDDQGKIKTGRMFLGGACARLRFRPDHQRPGVLGTSTRRRLGCQERSAIRGGRFSFSIIVSRELG